MAQFQWLVTRIEASLSSVLFPLYICCFPPSFLLFATIFQCQSAAVIYKNLSLCLLNASVHHTVSVSFLHCTPVSALRPLHIFFIFLFSLSIVCSLHMQTCRVLGVYPLRVGVIDV